MIIIIYLSLFISLVLSSSPPPVPVTPLQFQANIKITTEGIFPSTATGVLYYDYLNQIMRLDQSQLGATQTVVSNYNTMTSYSYVAVASKCDCETLTDPMDPYNVPIGSTYQGKSVIGTTSVTVWLFQDPVMKALGSSFQFYVDGNNYVLRVNVTQTSFFQTTTILMDLTQYVVGPPASSVFAMPSYCPCNIPPAPKPGSCPSNPGSACQCAASQQLSFCTGINYPVSTLITDIPTLDQFVQAAYQAATMVLPNPSSTCLANYKAFLCAFYFPECATSLNRAPVVYLPCADICPFCGCTNLPQANCSAISTSPCTMYGQPYCKN